MNKLCEHYGVDGVESVEIRYLNGTAIGFFKCSVCGMVYKQRYWRKKLSSLYIIDYGEMWTNQMLRCLRDEKLDIPNTAKMLKCTPSVLKWQMAKIGITGELVQLKKSWSYSRNAGVEEYHKAQVLALCEEYEEVTSDILKLYAPKSYKYLYKFDLGWLHEHMKLKVNTQNQRDEDVEMLRRVQNAVSRMFSNGMPKRQITPGFIAVTAGYEEPALHYLADKRPLTKAYIESVIENRTDWLRRRISAIAQERRMHGEKISIADVKREMSLKPNTFIKYEYFLKELIDELND
jgi:hypothetical protein